MTVEYFLTKPGGRARWRMRDASGKLLAVRPGRVHLPDTPEENRRIEKAVDEVLTQLATSAARLDP